MIDETTSSAPPLLEEGWAALRAGDGEGARQVFEEAGFSQFRRAAETPMNLVFDARV